MRTPWGYDVDGLGPIVSYYEFTSRMNGAYDENPRVLSALNAASQAVRNYCGWHVSPSLDCTAYPVGGGIVSKLPAGYVSAVTSVTEDGTELASTDYEWRRDGLLKGPIRINGAKNGTVSRLSIRRVINLMRFLIWQRPFAL